MLPPSSAFCEGRPAQPLATVAERGGCAAFLRGAGAFTIIESVIAVAVLAIFLLTSTMALNLFDTRAAKNRNTEAARAIVDDYVSYLLDENTAVPTATDPALESDLDGDGISDGLVCTSLPGRAVPSSLALVESRTATPSSTPPPVVSGTLYWRVRNVGTSFGLTNDADLVQVNFTLAYTYRGQPYYYKVMTYKGVTQ